NAIVLSHLPNRAIVREQPWHYVFWDSFQYIRDVRRSLASCPNARVFRVSLAVENVIMRTAAPKSSHATPVSVRILVADDHEVMRLGVRNLLEAQSGWSICAQASNGKEAIEMTLESRPDVIILDIAMPVMNGLEAAAQIAKVAPQVP